MDLDGVLDEDVLEGELGLLEAAGWLVSGLSPSGRWEGQLTSQS